MKAAIVSVLMQQLAIDFVAKRFTATVSTKTVQQRKYHLQANADGTITDGVLDFFTRLRPEFMRDEEGNYLLGANGKRIATGNEYTGFEYWLKAMNIPLPEVGEEFDKFLAELDFMSDDNAQAVGMNPFRVSVDEFTGKSRLSMVWEKPMIRIARRNPSTGAQEVTYIQPMRTANSGRKVKDSYLPEQYRRFIKRIRPEVEVEA